MSKRNLAMGIVIEMPLPDYAVRKKENILDVAEFFLHKRAVDHRRLQTFCFLAQVFCYGNLGEFMCDEKFEAWANGPTSRTVYERYSDWATLDIITVSNYRIADNKHALLLNGVWDRFKHVPTCDIISTIQSIDEWNIIRNGVGRRTPCFSVIPDDFFKTVYTKSKEV